MARHPIILAALCFLLTLPLMGCEQEVATQDPLVGKTILVAGASGRAGRVVIKQLEEQNLTFRSLTRNRDTAIERWGEDYRDMNWVEGDVKDPARMAEIMEGADLVISVIGSRDKEGPNGPEFVDYGGVKNLVDAAKSAGVEHFVLLTALGASDPKHPLNKVLGNALHWRFQGEEYLRKSGIPYTIIRPTGLVDDPAGEKGVYLAQGDIWREIFRGTITRGDLADVLIASLRDPSADFKTLEITNSTDIPPGEWNMDFADMLTDQKLAARLETAEKVR